MQVSQLQQAILDQVAGNNDNIIISGVAGCGKSTTLQLIAEVLRNSNQKMRICYLAFNNEICEDIEDKLLPFDVSVLTFHKWGNRSIRYKKQIDQYKYKNRIQEYFDREENPFDSLTVNHIKSISELLRTWYKPITHDSVMDAMLHLNIDMSQEWFSTHFDHLVAYVKELVKWGMQTTNKIDFVDMLVHPIRHKMPLLRFDVLLVDEAQDLSPIMHRMIEYAMNNYEARIIAVGDRKQAINEFAGAMPDSFDKLKEITKAIELPLSICYRCPDEVIKMAKTYVSEIEGTGKKGEVSHNLKIHEMMPKLETGDLIICRRNAPLVSLMFKLVSAGVKAIIKGKRFGDYLTHYVVKAEKSNPDYKQFPKTIRILIDEFISKTDNEDRIEMLNDVQNCLINLYESAEIYDFKTLKNLIDKMFSDSKKDEIGAVVLSSFHRSKGLQNPNVYILLDKPLAKPGSGQESNLAYVAITRTLNNLYFVNFDSRSRKKAKEAS